MFYINYFNSLILFFFIYLPSMSVDALTIKKECGEYFFEIQILNIKEYGEQKFIVYHRNKDDKKLLFYKSEPGVSFRAACVQNNKKQYYLLFQENCGGNGCPEDVYGVYDPRARHLILNPNSSPNGNTKEVEKIIGLNNGFFESDSTKYFCCGYQIGKARGNF